MSISICDGCLKLLSDESTDWYAIDGRRYCPKCKEKATPIYDTFSTSSAPSDIQFFRPVGAKISTEKTSLLAGLREKDAQEPRPWQDIIEASIKDYAAVKQAEALAPFGPAAQARYLKEYEEKKQQEARDAYQKKYDEMVARIEAITTGQPMATPSTEPKKVTVPFPDVGERVLDLS